MARRALRLRKSGAGTAAALSGRALHGFSFRFRLLPEFYRQRHHLCHAGAGGVSCRQRRGVRNRLSRSQRQRLARRGSPQRRRCRSSHRKRNRPPRSSRRSSGSGAGTGTPSQRRGFAATSGPRRPPLGRARDELGSRRQQFLSIMSTAAAGSLAIVLYDSR